MTDLTVIRSRLQSLRDDYTNRIVALDKDLHHKEIPVEKDFAEQATQMENKMVLEALDDEARDLVGHIDAALRRIDDGTYGTCSRCGETISPQRLDAVPYSTLCIDCAAEDE